MKKAFATALVLGLMAAPAWAPSAWAGVEEGLAAVEKGDYETARKEFETASAHGSAEAKYHLGALYHGGFGVQRSRGKAAELYRDAAIAGVTEAEFAIGLFHHRGWGGLEKNPDIAVEWYTKAAEKGSIDAQHNLGMMFATGEGVPVAYGSNPDYVKAYKWFGVVYEGVDTDEDRKKVQGMLDSIKKHLTPGQQVRAKQAVADWLAAHPKK